MTSSPGSECTPPGVSNMAPAMEFPSLMAILLAGVTSFSNGDSFEK